jgi:hypothetical protein
MHAACSAHPFRTDPVNLITYGEVYLHLEFHLDLISSILFLLAPYWLSLIFYFNIYRYLVILLMFRRSLASMIVHFPILFCPTVLMSLPLFQFV